MSNEHTTNASSISRRDVMLGAGALAAGALLIKGANSVYGADVAATGKFRIGLIGCGPRGRSAAKNALASADNLELVAIADIFPEILDSTVKAFSEQLKDQFNVPKERQFSGFDSYKKLIALPEVDYVIIATPPYFHPHFAEEAVKAKKHVFVEKPGAVDVEGCRKLYELHEIALKQGTGFVGGTQRRYQKSIQAIMNKIHEGGIGKAIAAQAQWNNRDWTFVEKKEGWSDVEWQIRNWRPNCWLSGDMPGVLLLHMTDLVNWAFDSVPVSAIASGEKQIREDVGLHGDIFDSIHGELRYSDGRIATVSTKIIPGAAGVKTTIYGPDGRATEGRIDGKKPFTPAKDTRPAYVSEHGDLIDSARAGKPIVAAKQLADATLTGILIREAAYTGEEVKWDFLLKESKMKLGPDFTTLSFDTKLPALDIPVPGKTKLI